MNAIGKREATLELILYRNLVQVDAIVTSVNKMGFFASVGPLPLFVSSNVCSSFPPLKKKKKERT